MATPSESTIGCTLVTFTEEVADALDTTTALGHFVAHGTAENSVKLAANNNEAMGVLVDKLQNGTGKTEEVTVALINGGGICKVRLGGTVAKDAGVTCSASGEGTTVAIGTAIALGRVITQGGGVNQDLVSVELGRIEVS